MFIGGVCRIESDLWLIRKCEILFNFFFDRLYVEGGEDD